LRRLSSISLSFFPALHSKQLVMRLSILVFPPFENGVMWSITSVAPSLTVLPQYWHVKLSLSKIVNLSLRYLLELPIRLVSDSGGKMRGGRFLDNRLSRVWGVYPKLCGWFGLPEPVDIKGRLAAFMAFAKLPKCLRYAPLDGNPGISSMFLWLGLCPNSLDASISLDKRTSSVRFL